jgi:hypothetical protein
MPAIIRPSSASLVSRRAALAHDAAIEHHRDPVGQRQDFLQLDRDQHDRLAGIAHREELRWMNSIAPISTPRVGWPTSSSTGSRSISRASTSFCWLPPEKFRAQRRVRAGARHSWPSCRRVAPDRGVVHHSGPRL